MSPLYNAGCYNIPLEFIMSSNCNLQNNCNSPYPPIIPVCGKSSVPYAINTNCAPPYDPYWPNKAPCGKKSLCGCGCQNFYGCYPILPVVYKISLTITGYSTYSFVITDLAGNQIAQGTAVLCGNVLQLTFLDADNNNVGYANIVFVDYNIARRGVVTFCGSIKCTFPLCYTVTPNIQCCQLC